MTQGNSKTTGSIEARPLKRNTYRQCHRCQISALVDRIRRGEAVDAGTVEDAKRICIECGGPADVTKSGKGICRVSLDALEEMGNYIYSKADKDYMHMMTPTNGKQKLTNADDAVEDAMIEFLRAFAGLSPTAAITLHGLLNKKPLHEIGATIGVSKQAVSKAFQVAVKKFPELKAISPETIRQSLTKGPARKVST